MWAELCLGSHNSGVDFGAHQELVRRGRLWTGALELSGGEQRLRSAGNAWLGLLGWGFLRELLVTVVATVFASPSSLPPPLS